MHRTRSAVPAALAAALLATAMLRPEPARAGCNEIPSLTTARRGAIGTIDRPFARAGGSPGDFVGVARACGSPALKDANGDGKIDEYDYVVTVVFTPPRGGPANVVALTAAKDCSALSCGERGPVPHCVAGSAAGITVHTGDEKLRFRFPDTDAFLAPAGDGHTFTGPAAVAVTPAGQPLPCELAAKPCTSLVGGAHFACADELFAGGAGSCGTGRAELDPTFAHFTALPPVNDYQQMCHEAEGVEPACLDQEVETRFAVDEAGNVGLPMRWTGILRDQPGKPKKDNRRLRGSTPVRAFTGAEGAVAIPGDAFLASYTPVGTQFDEAPLLVSEKLAKRPRELVLFGEADEPESVLWISRRKRWDRQCKPAPGKPAPVQACEQDSDCPGSTCGDPLATPVYFACSGGHVDGRPCTRPSHCPGGGQCLAGSLCVAAAGPTTTACKTDADCAADQECGLGLFEFRDRLVAGTGPVVIPKSVKPGKEAVYRSGANAGKKCSAHSNADRCVGYRAEAKKYRTKP